MLRCERQGSFFLKIFHKSWTHLDIREDDAVRDAECWLINSSHIPLDRLPSPKKGLSVNAKSQQKQEQCKIETKYIYIFVLTATFKEGAACPIVHGGDLV